MKLNTSLLVITISFIYVTITMSMVWSLYGACIIITCHVVTFMWCYYHELHWYRSHFAHIIIYCFVNAATFVVIISTVIYQDTFSTFTEFVGCISFFLCLIAFVHKYRYNLYSYFQGHYHIGNCYSLWIVHYSIIVNKIDVYMMNVCYLQHHVHEKAVMVW